MTAKIQKNSTRPAAYRLSSLSPEKRVKDLLARMTLAEKAAQMMCVWQKNAQRLVDVRGDFEQSHL